MSPELQGFKANLITKMENRAKRLMWVLVGINKGAFKF